MSKGEVWLIVVVCSLCAAALFFLRPQPAEAPDLAGINEIVREVQENPAGPDVASENLPGFVVLAQDGSVLYESADGLAQNIADAIRQRYAILPVSANDGDTHLTLLVADPPESAVPAAAAATAAMAVFAAVIAVLLRMIFVRRAIVRPFEDMRDIAEEIARGNLSAHLPMDRGHIFGAFTESFDGMRSALERSRAAEDKASREKQELVAKLSHDLRTPIAAIRAASELGALKAQDPADRKAYENIAAKALQMNLLVSNLLNAAVEEQTEITVALRPVPSDEICEMLHAADYLQRAQDVFVPQCTVAADPVRLLQIFDNIMSNAYKYAPGTVSVSGFVGNGELILDVEDEGGGVPEEDIGSLHVRYFRARNAEGTEGAGLGLYICSQLAAAMGGEILVANTVKGLRVTLVLPLAAGALKQNLRSS